MDGFNDGSVPKSLGPWSYVANPDATREVAYSQYLLVGGMSRLTMTMSHQQAQSLATFPCSLYFST